MEAEPAHAIPHSGREVVKAEISITEGMTSLDKLGTDPGVVVRSGEAIDPRGRCVVYGMRRTQRALDNPALETAIAAANVFEQPVVVFFGLLAIIRWEICAITRS